MDAVGSTTEYFNELIEFVKDFSLDVIIIATLFTVLFALGLYFGKELMVSFILSLYPAGLAFLHFPFSDSFLLFGNGDQTKLFFSNAIIFFAIFAVFMLITTKIISVESYSGPIKEWFEVGVLAIATIVLLISFSYHVLPITALHDFSHPIDNLFENAHLFFWGLTLPLIGIFFSVRQ